MRTLAAKMIACGTNSGAAINQLRALMEASTATRDERWRARISEIPAAVDSAVEKYGKQPEAEPATEEPAEVPQNNKQGHQRFQLKPFSTITISAAPSYLVKGVLPRIGLAVVWGPPKCGKSFWTFDLVMHVATGRRYRGRRVQQGVVVYLALEGGSGFAGRVEAWRQRHLADRPEPVPFYLLDVPVDLDAQIAVERNKDGPVVATVEHMKDAEAGAVLASKLERVELGADADGDKLSSCIAIPTEPGAAGLKLTKVQRFAFDLLQKLIATEGVTAPAEANLPASFNVCLADTWRKRFYQTYPAEKQDTKKKALLRATLDLEEAKLITLWREFVWLPDKRDTPRS
jgi:AAA domain